MDWTLLADDQQLVRAGFAIILSAQEDIEVVASCADGVEAVAAARRLRPDVAPLDIRMQRLDGHSAPRPPDRGRVAATTQPPWSPRPAREVPPRASTRSRIPTIAKPLPAVPAGTRCSPRYPPRHGHGKAARRAGQLDADGTTPVRTAGLRPPPRRRCMPRSVLGHVDAEFDDASAGIHVQGDRYPEQMQRMIDR